MVEYGKTFSEGLRFAVTPKRWLPFFIIDALLVTAVFSYVMANSYEIQQIISGVTSDFTIVFSILGFILLLFAGFVIWVLTKIFISGAVIHQSLKPAEFRKSWTVSKHRYLSLFAVSLIVGLLSGIVSAVPYVGWIISIFVGLVFFFSLPPVIADRMSFDNALNTSYNIFRNRPVDVLIVWVLVAIITVSINLLFAAPALAIAVGTIFPQIAAVSAGSMEGTELISFFISNGWSLLPAVLVFLVGASITTVFGLYSQTHFYLQLRKKKA